MLENESTLIEPIIKDLTSHHMPPNTPTVLVFLLCEPGMSKHLYIKIKDLETGMMDMKFRSSEEEKAMVVNPFRSSIKMQKGRDVLLGVWGIDELAGLEVEIRGVELKGLLVIGDAKTEVAKFVDRSRTLLKSLCLVHRSILACGEIVFQFWECFCNVHGSLTIDQMKREIVDWVIKSDLLSSPGSI
jgi:hypothetical protein